MSRRSVLALGIVLALSAVAAVWSVVEPGGPPAPAATRSAHSPEVSRSNAMRLERATEPPSSPASAPGNGSSGRAPEGTWIRGRVRIPEGLPPDDHVEVAARYVSLDDESAGVSGLDDEGRFVVAFPEDVDTGWLELRSRYLYLEHEVEVDLEDPPGELILEPVLGGCVRGRLIPSRPAVDLAGTRVEMYSGARGSSDGACLRASIVGGDLAFEIAAVPPRAEYTLSVDSLSFLPERRVIEVRPGSTTDVLVELRARSRVSGRVLDPEGRPAARAHLTWVEPREWKFAGKARPDAWTSDDGSFSLTSARSGPSTLLVRCGDYLPERRSLGLLDDGREVGGVEIRLRSSRISGVVRWPDGRAVRKCSIQLLPTQPSRSIDSPWREPDVHSSPEPSFSFVVASEGPYLLSVRTEATDAMASDEATGIAEVDGIVPGGPPLTVVLRPANTVCGRVVDDLGHPLRDFFLEARLSGAPPWTRLYTDISARFQKEDGAFALGGLTDGQWVFVASDDLNLIGPESDPITVPVSSPIVLVVPRAAELSGVVLEPSGAPAPFADVEPSSGAYATTDASGRFRLPHVEPGSIALTAVSKSWAPSRPVNVEAKPGGALGDLVLQLRRGGRIAGAVFDAEGRPQGDADLWISNEEEAFAEGFSSDAEGRFETRCLAPGNYTLLCRRPRLEEDVEEEKDVPEQVSVAVFEDRVSSVLFGRPR